MSDELLGRRAYDRELARAVGRVEGKVDSLLEHAEKINGRLGKAEAAIDALQTLRDTASGQRSERSMWVRWGSRAAMTLVGLDFVQRRAADLMGLIR